MRVVRSVHTCIPPDDFARWVASAVPQSRITYCTVTMSHEADSTNHKTMIDAREGYLRGELELTQKRTEAGVDCYATKRRHIDPPGDCWVGIAK